MLIIKVNRFSDGGIIYKYSQSPRISRRPPLAVTYLAWPEALESFRHYSSCFRIARLHLRSPPQAALWSTPQCSPVLKLVQFSRRARGSLDIRDSALLRLPRSGRRSFAERSLGDYWRSYALVAVVDAFCSRSRSRSRHLWSWCYSLRSSSGSSRSNDDLRYCPRTRVNPCNSAAIPRVDTWSASACRNRDRIDNQDDRGDRRFRSSAGSAVDSGGRDGTSRCKDAIDPPMIPHSTYDWFICYIIFFSSFRNA